MAQAPKYTPENVEKAQAYLDGAYETVGDVIPSIAGLSLYLGVSRTALNNWQNDPEKNDMVVILGQIKAKQESILINMGLKGDFNSNIVKLVLGKHGYHEKKDIEATGKDRGPIESRTVFNFIPVNGDDE